MTLYYLKMSLDDCTCPFCPLIEANVNVDDVEVVLYNNSYKIRLPSYPQFGAQFAQIALAARNGCNLFEEVPVKSGYLFTETNKEGMSYNVAIERLSKNKFKLGFYLLKR